MTATIQDLKVNGDRLLLTPRVPQGLAAAVEGLTREVIRHRPDDIYVFAAHHFEKLLQLREQYDAKTEHKKSMKILREMNETIKEQHTSLESEEADNFVEQTGWTLNETAKVLERHRSIFGETGQKISTEEVRELANEMILTSSKIQESSPRRKSEKYASASSSKKKESPPLVSHDFCDTRRSRDSKNHPKIISQIPIAKDIKTELRKNRISSKERTKIEEKRTQVCCEYSRETVEKTSKRSTEKTKRSYEVRSEHRKSSRTEDNTKKKTNTIKDSMDYSTVKMSSRSVSMDHVKNYVVQTFAGITSLNELQTPSYVEKVQEVIDETSTIIKEKVDALRTGVVKAAKAKQLKTELSLNNDEDFKASNNRNTIQTSKSLDNESSFDQSEFKVSDISDATTESKISLPAVRSTSSKSTSRSQSRSDSNGLVLPPISPESTKSPKAKEELVLPVLSPPRSNAESPETSTDLVDRNEEIMQVDRMEKCEEFKDSLNVTPELLETPQRPDSLENSEEVDTSNSSGNISPLETLKDKLLEIEEVQKRIEGVLDDNINNDDKQSNEKKIEDKIDIASKIQDKLVEIQESEKRIEQILDSQSTTVIESEALNSDIKSKLQELEEVEKRIENILVNDTGDEHLDSGGTMETNMEQADSNLTPETNKPNAKEDLKNEAHINLNEVTSDKNHEKYMLVIPEINRVTSPYSYILTEGSPCEIPDSVTTVIIPDRIPTPDSDTLQVEIENGEVCSTLISPKEITTRREESIESQEENKSSSIHDAFGEIIDTKNADISTVDIDFIRGIKVNHDIIAARQDLGFIQEEQDKELDEAQLIDSEDEKVLKVVTSSLEDILENDEIEYVMTKEIRTTANNKIKENTEDYSPEAAHGTEYESTDETKETSITDGFAENTEANENSLDIEETTARSAESTNEIKETSITTDRSSLSFDPAVPIVPELNLDSLPDLTISSFNMTDDEQKENKFPNEIRDSSASTGIISSGDTKENLRLDGTTLERKFTTRIDRKENESKLNEIPESSPENIKEMSSDTLQEKSNKLTNELQEENVKQLEANGSQLKEVLESSVENIQGFTNQDSQATLMKKSDKLVAESRKESLGLETKEYETIEKFQSNKLESTTNSDTDEKTSIAESENIKVEYNNQIGSNVEVVNIEESVDLLGNDNYENTSDKITDNTKISSDTNGNQNNLLAQQGSDTESPSRKFKDDPPTIEQNCLGVIENGHNNQLVDSSRGSSQCTIMKRLDSDDVSIKTNPDETTQQTYESEYTNTIHKEERMNTEKSSSNDFQVSDADMVVNKEIENSNNETNEKKEYHIYVPEMSTSKDLDSSSESSTFKSAATKIQAGKQSLILLF